MIQRRHFSSLSSWFKKKRWRLDMESEREEGSVEWKKDERLLKTILDLWCCCLDLRNMVKWECDVNKEWASCVQWIGWTQVVFPSLRWKLELSRRCIGSLWRIMSKLKLGINFLKVSSSPTMYLFEFIFIACTSFHLILLPCLELSYLFIF